MIRHFLPVSALLLGSGLLLFAGGLNGLILPVRGTQEGFGAGALGFLGTGWAVAWCPGSWGRWVISAPSASCAPSRRWPC